MVISWNVVDLNLVPSASCYFCPSIGQRVLSKKAIVIRLVNFKCCNWLKD